MRGRIRGSRTLTPPMLSEAAEPEFVARAYRPGDEAAILALFEQCFGVPQSLERWRWKFERTPPAPAAIEVLESRGEIVGHLARQAFPAFVEGRREMVETAIDLMVSREARGQRASVLLMGRASAHGASCRISFPSDQTVAISRTEPIGVEYLGRIPQWVRWRDAAALTRERAGLRHLPGRALAALQVAASSAIARPPPDVVVSALEQPGGELDRLAESLARTAPCIRIRDSRYVRWRWLDEPERQWRLLAARSTDGGLRGFAAFGPAPEPRSDGTRAGRIADLLACDPRATTALLVTAAGELFAAGCELVTFDCHDPRPWARRACLRAGFLPRGVGPHVIVRPLTQEGSRVAVRMEDWYLTLGDSDLA